MIAGLPWHPVRVAALAVAVGLVGFALLASTSTLTVPAVTVGTQTAAVTVPQIAPSVCGNATSLNNIILATSAITPGVAGKNSLILGESGSNDLGSTPPGSNESDCCIGSNSGTQKFESSCVYHN